LADWRGGGPGFPWREDGDAKRVGNVVAVLGKDCGITGR